MNDISWTKTGIIKKVGKDAVVIELPDTGDQITWAPILPGSLEAGQEVELEMRSVEETKKLNTPNQEEDQRMRKMLEELLN